MKFKVLILFTLLFAFASVFGSDVGSKIYRCYVDKDMSTWRSVIDSLQKEKELGHLSDDAQWQLLEYQYGYLGWAVSEKKTMKKVAEIYLDVAEDNLDELVEKQGASATSNAYHAAFVAYEISLNPIKAPFIGLKCMKYGETAVEQDSTNYFALIQYGNIMNYMPEAFGGSKDKALANYLKAKEIMSREDRLRNDNWLYMNLLLTIADIYKGKKDFVSTKQYYQEVLELEPDYEYVKELLKSVSELYISEKYF